MSQPQRASPDAAPTQAAQAQWVDQWEEGQHRQDRQWNDHLKWNPRSGQRNKNQRNLRTAARNCSSGVDAVLNALFRILNRWRCHAQNQNKDHLSTYIDLKLYHVLQRLRNYIFILFIPKEGICDASTDNYWQSDGPQGGDEVHR